MKQDVKNLRILVVSICMLLCFSLNFAVAAQEDTAQEEVRVPISLQVPHAIAGAEFEISYTSGLTFTKFEKSSVIQSAMSTPVVEKNGKTYFGFFSGSNDYVPENGVLDVGFLVFAYSGEPNQSVTVTESKYVEVIDKDTTNSSILVLNQDISVPLAPGASLKIGATSYVRWILLAAGALVFSGAFVFYRKKMAKKPVTAPIQPATTVADVGTVADDASAKK